MESIIGIDIYPIISLTIFVLFFVAVIYLVMKKDRKQIEELSNLPLEK